MHKLCTPRSGPLPERCRGWTACRLGRQMHVDSRSVAPNCQHWNVHGPRFRPSPRSFRLFAARRRLAHRPHRRASQGRPPAGGGVDRHQQHVRRAGVLRQARGRRHPADHRLRAVDRLGGPGQPATRAGTGRRHAGPAAARAACRHRGRVTATSCISIRGRSSIMPATSRRTSSVPGSTAAATG